MNYRTVQLQRDIEEHHNKKNNKHTLFEAKNKTQYKNKFYCSIKNFIDSSINTQNHCI